MSFIPVVKYLVGLGVFGFAYWILNGIFDSIIAEDVHTAGASFNFIHMMWTGCLLIYLIFGGWWVIRTYNEDRYRQY